MVLAAPIHVSYAAGGISCAWSASVTENTITIDWSDPGGKYRYAAGSPRTVMICYKKAGSLVGACNGGTVIITYNKPHVITGLDSGEEYKVKVLAFTEHKNIFGKWRNPEFRKLGTFTQKTNDSGTDPRQGNVQIVNRSPTSLTAEVTWSHPEDFKMIRIYCRRLWFPFHKEIIDVPNPSSTTTVTFNNLKSCKDYKIRAEGYISYTPMLIKKIGRAKGRTTGSCKTLYYTTSVSSILTDAVIEHQEDILIEYTQYIDSYVYGDTSLFEHIIAKHPELSDEADSLLLENAGDDDITIGYYSMQWLAVEHFDIYQDWQEEPGLDAFGMSLIQFMQDEYPDLYTAILDEASEIYPGMEVPKIRIEKTHNSYQGHYEYVSITTENREIDMGGFDFLIAYDASALAFTEAEPGQLLEDCGWEYFTYRYGADGNCGDACPSGLLRIIAMAESNDGANHPSCYGPPDTDPHELATMKFLVTNDRTFEGQYIPIYFFWDDCGDNSISSTDGELLYIDRAIYDFEDNLIWNEDDDDEFPEDARIPFVGAPDFCLNPDPDKPQPIHSIDFIHGGIDIVPSDSIDDRGDINLNGTAYEIADAVTFTNYFIYGQAAFSVNVAGQIAATDINADGIVLTVGDLIYMINVIVNGWPPIPKLQPVDVNGWPPIPKLQPVDADIEASAAISVNHSAVAVSTDSPLDIGGGYFVIEHDGYLIGEPHLINGASHMTLKYHDQDGILKVLVYSIEGDRLIHSGQENIFGRNLPTKIDTEPLLPVEFILHQNYPNPFNAGTRIIYELPKATHVTIDIINSMGRKVTTLIDRRETAGVHSAAWNGNDDDGNSVASGIYFYNLKTEDYSETRKMTLLK